MPWVLCRASLCVRHSLTSCPYPHSPWLYSHLICHGVFVKVSVSTAAFVSACQHERVFCGTGMDGLPLVIKVVYVDSREHWVYENLAGNPKLRMVPKVTLLPHFGAHKGHAVCAVVMPRLHSLSDAMHDPALVPPRDAVVAGALISQLLQVDLTANAVVGPTPHCLLRLRCPALGACS